MCLSDISIIISNILFLGTMLSMLVCVCVYLNKFFKYFKRERNNIYCFEKLISFCKLKNNKSLFYNVTQIVIIITNYKIKKSMIYLSPYK